MTRSKLRRLAQRLANGLSRKSVRRRQRAAQGHRRLPTMLERLEERTLFATFPNAPYTGSNFDGTIYANQNGDALITGNLPTEEINGYTIFYNATGSLQFRATLDDTKIAWYNDNVGPRDIENDDLDSTSLTAGINTTVTAGQEGLIGITRSTAGGKSTVYR